MTITGQLIIAGPREGQLINPTTDKAIFLFDTLPNNKMSFAAIGEPALGWPDVTLDRCRGRPRLNVTDDFHEGASGARPFAVSQGTFTAELIVASRQSNSASSCSPRPPFSNASRLS